MNTEAATGRKIKVVFVSRRLRSKLLFLFTLFFLSGFSALAYQTAWQRMLGVFAGSDSVATTVIVGAFLFGLGIGSLVGASFADRLSLRGALRAFALCEIGIGAFACFSRTVFYDLFLDQFVSLAGDPLRGPLVVFLALLLPTALMGMSLPLLARVVVDTIEGASARIGWLYGLNTLGAAAGALVTGWVMIGIFGIAVTVYAAAAINFLIGGSALLISGGMPSRGPAAGPLPIPSATGRSGAGDAAGTSRLLLLWSVMVFVSGFLVISLEIVWFRVLGTLLRSDAYAFSLILAVFLLGDGLGIVAGAKIAHRLAQPRRAFQLLQGVMGVYALFSFMVLYAVNAHAETTLLGVEGSKYAIFLLVWLVVLPPAFFLGMSFPITQRDVQNDPAMVGRRVGLVQLCNILGNTAGAVATGLVMLHWLGTALTLRLIGAVCLVFVLAALADGVWTRAPELRRSGGRWIEGGLALALLVLLVLFPGNGRFWSALHKTSLAENAIVLEDRTGVAVLRAAGALMQSVKVYADWIGPDYDTLFIGGHAQSRVPFLRDHGGLGVLGAIMHPDPQDILVIGQGSGGTPVAAGINPRTQRIRVIDIVAPVFDVMRQAAARSGQDTLHAPLRAYHADPRYTRTVADARHVLLTEDTSYDIIEADAIYPTAALAGQLYSVDFFRLTMRRLKPGGYVVQWMATDRTLAGFLQVFPYVVRANALLIGSMTPIAFSHDRLAAELAGPAGEHLTRMGWKREEVAAWLLAGAERSWTPTDPRTDQDVNTDLFPKDEYHRDFHNQLLGR
jgi:spermidine synthase